MRRLVYLAALAAAAPDTQLKRAAALARWVDRTGPAPPSWTVSSPKDVTVGREVHAGKIRARGAPEARGKCVEGTCALLSEKTHVWDVAHRPWLLPYIADRATGGDRAFLVALIRHASAEDPDDRPSFAELVGAIDRRVEGATVN